jgi:hypothetical protein
MAAPPPGRAIYAAYIEEQVEAQDSRKGSLEQRGLAVITTSGTLVTLLFGLAALSTKQNATFSLPQASRVLIVIAIGFFFFAIVTAIVTNVPFFYQVVEPEPLHTAVRDRWDDSDAVAERKVAYTRLTVMESAQKMNTIKAVTLFIAVIP